MELQPLCKRGLVVLTTLTYKIMLIGTFFGILIILSIIYTTIFAIARRHMRQIQDQAHITSTARYNADLKIAKMLILVFGMFYLSYVPTFLVFILSLILGTSTWIRIIMNISSRLIYLNSAVNPLAYVWKDRSFRQAFLSLLCCRALPADNSLAMSFQP